MSKKGNIYQNLLKDYVYTLLKEAKEVKMKRDKSECNPEKNFYDGMFLGFYKIIDPLYDQALCWDIPLEKIGLDNIVPDRDLL